MSEEKGTRPISVAIITKNEEVRLPACLRGTGFADEVLVLDSESTDRTVEIARSFGAEVRIERWRGYSEQKQLAVDYCRNPWVLILDADERIPSETVEAITKALSDWDPAVSAFSFRRKNLLHGKWVRYCGWWPDRVVRLVDKTRGQMDSRPVHERWITEGRVSDLDACIEHVSFNDCSQLLDKMDRYSSLASEELYRKRVKAGALTPLTHGLWTLFKTYLLELGFLQGFDGLLISLTNAGGSFMKYAKLREKWERLRIERDDSGNPLR